MDLQQHWRWGKDASVPGGLFATTTFGCGQRVHPPTARPSRACQQQPTRHQRRNISVALNSSGHCCIQKGLANISTVCVL